MKSDFKQHVKTSVILASVFGGLLVIAIAGLVWLLVDYLDLKNNFDSKTNFAVAEAKKKQADKLEADFAEREKEPNLQFVGPEDLGRLTFKYPKTWSTYIDEGTSYQAYFAPKFVKKYKTDSKYSLRLKIENKEYETVLKKYDSLVKKGELKTSVFKVGEVNGTRLDGKFSKTLRGSAVIIKNRDKTITLQTDLSTFSKEFDDLVKTITLNK